MVYVVGFTGLAYVGKTTAALFAAEFCLGEVISFAGPLKKLARDFFGWDGLKDERGRRLLQVIGTECGRDYNPDIWTEKFEETAREIVSRDKSVFVDDVRFDNEAKSILNMGGMIISIHRDPDSFEGGLQGIAATHRSEEGIDPYLINHMITNSGTLEELNQILRVYFL